MNASIELSLRMLRREGRRLMQMTRYRAWAMHSLPILFCNSFPKSGTHLLTQVLSGFTKLAPVVESGMPAVVTYDSVTGEQRSEADIMSDLKIASSRGTLGMVICTQPPPLQHGCAEMG
jgi:hypothetical protein